MIICTHRSPQACMFFFFNDTATTEIYTLSLHDALPISPSFRMSVLQRALSYSAEASGRTPESWSPRANRASRSFGDRKSTRLNSSHGYISYAVFCLKKKKKSTIQIPVTRIHHMYLTHIC